ncbi:MAG: YdhR family protein [Thainema sp.]
MTHSTKFTLLQVNFRHPTASNPAAQQAAMERAHAIAHVAGLCWKTWIYNAETSELGGIYIFEDATSAQAYLDGPIFTSLKQLPGVEDMQVKVFAVDEAKSRLTHSPLPTEP